jgi:hypothetical protein
MSFVEYTETSQLVFEYRYQCDDVYARKKKTCDKDAIPGEFRPLYEAIKSLTFAQKVIGPLYRGDVDMNITHLSFSAGSICWETNSVLSVPVHPPPRIQEDGFRTIMSECFRINHMIPRFTATAGQWTAHTITLQPAVRAPPGPAADPP